MSKLMAIRIPEKIERRLDRLAKKTRRTKSYYVREAVLQHLDDLEDCYLAEKRLADRKPSIPIDELERILDLEE